MAGAKTLAISKGGAPTDNETSVSLADCPMRSSDRAKAIGFFYAAAPAASVVGSLMASWLLGIHWSSIAGWRWIFIVEGIPPVLIGIVTIFYLTDRPEQSRWLSQDERTWISREIGAEVQAKKKIRNYTIWQAFRDKRVILLMVPYFLALTGAQASVFWIPTFIKRLSGLPGPKVALWVALAGLVGIARMLLNGWHSVKTGERRWHTVIPLAVAGVAYLLLSGTHNFPMVIALLIVGGGCMFGYYPVFWSMPTLFLSESAAAACFGLINSVGHTGGSLAVCSWILQRSDGKHDGGVPVHWRVLCTGELHRTRHQDRQLRLARNANFTDAK